MKLTVRFSTLAVLLLLGLFHSSAFSQTDESTQSTDPVSENTNKKTNANAVEFKLKGIKESNIRENVEIYVNQIDEDDRDGSESYLQSVRDAISKGVRVFGYYNSQVNLDLQQRAGKSPLLVADVALGKPVTLEGVDVEIDGAAETDPEFEKLTQILPKVGEQLNHERYDDFKSHLQKLASQRGYFDADFPVHRLEVMPATNQGWWRLQFHSGDRYRYGDFTFSHAQIREDYLRNMLIVKSGDPYLIQDVSSVTNEYNSSEWFSSVVLKPTLREQEKLVDFDVLLQPKKKNGMEVGIGYSSDVGPRFQLGWKKPWINDRGHSIRSDFYVSSPKQTLSVTYKMPLLVDPLYQYYEFAGGIENEKDDDTRSVAATLSGMRYWNSRDGWQFSLGLKSRYDSFTQADIKNKTLLLYPSSTISRTRSFGGIFPTYSDKLSLTVDLGRKLWLSDVDFLSVRASGGLIFTLAENHRFLTRLDLGWMKTNDFHRIPPAMRFFAGGDRSVRGYGYKKISPKDSNGKVLGASKLATGTLEYQYQVHPSWWVASFFDAGLAADSFAKDELRYGTGMGIRWASPVGAIKFDIATPIRDKDKSKNIQFYIGLGTEL
ncbi:MAG: autotransporter assembly complex family protein [Pasteurellaceae bacterium]|nr:autotransporter assembly complex family protein [Pasteurellaceae bacterium]